jgi:DNA-binding transcriptional MocR family regulator
MGQQGIDIAATESLLATLHLKGIHPKILYTIPTFQNPTGLTLPEASRRAILDLARRYNLTIIEDDPYRDLYYDPTNGPLPTSLPPSTPSTTKPGWYAQAHSPKYSPQVCASAGPSPIPK